MGKYEIGDIVYVKEFEDENKENISYHSFVIIDNDGKATPVDYFGFIVSSKTKKSKECSPFKYNEPIHKNDNNKLKTDSIVKCDQVYELPKKCIEFRIGHADTADVLRFLQAYTNYLNSLK